MSNGIQYTPNLIESFERDHRALLHSYGRLVKTANKADFPTFQTELALFKSMLVSHLLKEAVKLFEVPPEVKNQDPFQQLLFSKIVPNCKKLGLLDANDGWLRTRFDALGVSQFEDWADTGEEYLELDAVTADRLAAEGS